MHQVEYVEETHPPTRESLNMLLAAVDKRDKYRFFGKPVTDEQVCVDRGVTCTEEIGGMKHLQHVAIR